jgi:hypothetical protein
MSRLRRILAEAANGTSNAVPQGRDCRAGSPAAAPEGAVLMRIRIEADDGAPVGEFVTLRTFGPSRRS